MSNLKPEFLTRQVLFEKEHIPAGYKLFVDFDTQWTEHDFVTDALNSAIEDYNKKAKQNCGLGRMFYYGELQPSEINVQDVSHLITDVIFRKNKIYGKYKVTNSLKGAMLKTILENDIEPKFRLISVGRVEGKEKLKTFIDEIISFDIEM